MKKPLLIGGVLAVLMIGVLAAFGMQSRGEETPQPAAVPPVSPQAVASLPALIIGDAKAPVTLIEYGDYQCSSCTKFHKGAYPQLKERYIDTGKLKIEYRPFPVIGPDSPRAAVAAVCAAEQEKFPAFNDVLYGYVDREYFSAGRNGYGAGVYSDARLGELARRARLDEGAFSTCLAAERTAANVPQFIARGQAERVAGTPTFVLSGQKIVGPQPFAVFATLIDAELARQ